MSKAAQTKHDYADIEFYTLGFDDDDFYNVVPTKPWALSGEIEFFKNQDFHSFKIIKEDEITHPTSGQKTSNVEDIEFPNNLQEELFCHSPKFNAQVENMTIEENYSDISSQSSHMEIEQSLKHPQQVVKIQATEMPIAIIPASELLALQRQQLLEYEKATNMAKFYVRILMKVLPSSLDNEKEKCIHLKFIDRYFEKNNRKNKTSADMTFLFGLQDNPRNNRWAAQRRHIMHRTLAEANKRKMVLENNYIKEKQKVHYLYSLKIYEWRLNRAQLVGNFN